ncbi:MAG: glycosyltransferase family 4 protein [Acidimicrobiia bacterium]
MTLRLALHTGQLNRPVPGGIGRYVEGLVAHLPEAGIDVEPFAGGRWRSPAWQRFRLPPLRLPDGTDVVHAPSLAVPPPGDRPLVVTIHDLAFSYLPPRGETFHRRGLDLARSEAAAVVVPSAFTASQVEAARFEPGRVHVVAHGIDPPGDVPDAAVTERLGRLATGDPYLLAVGTVEPRKGLDVLAQAFRTLNGVRLLVAGPRGWGDVPGLDRPGIGRLGTVSDSLLDALYRRAVALVMPSHTEGFGLPALEAMARGCPVVVSAAGSLPEVVGDAGAVVPPGDPDALAGTLTRVLADDDLRARLADAGRRRAAGFTWAACAQGHLAAYEAALGVRRRHS